MAVKIILPDATTLTTNYKVHHLNPAQRAQRALKLWGAFMGAAIISIFIPVLHFVLVPLFILVAFIMGFNRYKEVSFVNLEDLKCPKCQANLKQKEVHQTVADLSSKIYCYECRSSMRLEVEPQSNLA